MTDTVITDTIEYLTCRRAFVDAALEALMVLRDSDDGPSTAATAKPQATKPARKAVTHAPTPVRGTRPPPAMPVPMGGVRGRVLLALQGRGMATTREIAGDRGSTITSTSSALQSLAKAGFCTLAGKTWTAVPQKAAVGHEFDVAWNGTKERNGEAPSLVAPRDRKQG